MSTKEFGHPKGAYEVAKAMRRFGVEITPQQAEQWHAFDSRNRRKPLSIEEFALSVRDSPTWAQHSLDRWKRAGGEAEYGEEDQF